MFFLLILCHFHFILSNVLYASEGSDSGRSLELLKFQFNCVAAGILGNKDTTPM